MLLIFVLLGFMVDDVLAKSRVEAADTASKVLQDHPRILENCVEQFEGAEGAHTKGFQLQKVSVLTTSGLQTPHVHTGQASLHNPDDHLHFCSFEKMNKYPDIGSYLDTLSMKEKFHNKKTKSAFKNLEAVPNAKDCGKHSLSSFGVLQLINLGKYMFKSYFGKLKSLDSMFLSREFASTFGDQTLFQSLSALLYGLLNEKQFVYTHVAKLSSDFSTASQDKGTQHSLHYFVEQSFIKENHLFKDSKVFSFNTGNIDNKLSGAKVSSKDIISYISNSLCHKPQNHGTMSISYDDVNHIFNLSDSYNNYLTTSSLFWSYSAARTASLWKLVKNWLSPNHEPNIKETSNDNGKDDLRIIAVDDLLMFSILRTLNVPLSRHIAPASRLIVESFAWHDSDLVFDSVNPNKGQMREMSSVKQGGINIDTKSFPKSILQNQFTMLNNDNIPEKDTLNNSLKVKKRSQKKVHKDDLSVLSANKIPTFNLQDKKSDKFKLPKSQTFHTYIRLLYNGQVVTSFIPGCNSDEIITLGMCSFDIFEHFLNSIQW